MRQAGGEIVGDVHEDVEPRDVDCAERRALWPADRGACDRVDFLDCIGPVGESLENAHEAVHRDMVGDESRRVLRHDHVLSEPAIGKVAHSRDDGRIGVGRRNDLEQRQVSRRIEKMRAEPMSAEIVAAPFGEARNRQAGCIGADDGAGAAARVDTLEKGALRIRLFDDGFDDPVGLRDPFEIRVEPPGPDAADCVGRKKRIGFELARALEALARGLRGNVEQRDRVAGVAQMCRRSARPLFRRPARRRIVFSAKRTACFAMLHSRRIPLSIWRASPWHDEFVLALAACCLGLSTVAAGQTRATTADLGGTIVDQSSAVLPGATVTAQNVDTNQARSAMTDERGHFLIPALPPGTYNVRAELQGFAPRTLEDVVLTLGSLIDVRLTLNVAGGQEIVLVAGDAPVIDTQRTVVSSVISQAQIQHLPINGRNFIGFSLLAPGVATDRTPQQGASGTSGLSFAGQRARSNNITVDGLDNNDSIIGSVRATFSQEAVREFQVLTNSYSAEFGKASGGVVNIVTKSGTNTMARQSVLLSPGRGAEFEGSLRALQSGGTGHRSREGPVFAEAVRRHARRSAEAGSHVLFPVVRAARYCRAQLRHDRRHEQRDVSRSELRHAGGDSPARRLRRSRRDMCRTTFGRISFSAKSIIS